MVEQSSRDERLQLVQDPAALQISTSPAPSPVRRQLGCSKHLVRCCTRVRQSRKQFSVLTGRSSFSLPAVQASRFISLFRSLSPLLSFTPFLPISFLLLIVLTYMRRISRTL
ncbi:uncharacterized protein BDW70DRAFT_111842 [Aspergillus foveolatus]|uniref:uncharacterized protein n=1 Tax=Aspergillus foveolatus TaxID=210207 RepID=UPI003CCD6E7B